MVLLNSNRMSRNCFVVLDIWLNFVWLLKFDCLTSDGLKFLQQVVTPLFIATLYTKIQPRKVKLQNETKPPNHFCFTYFQNLSFEFVEQCAFGYMSQTVSPFLQNHQDVRKNVSTANSGFEEVYHSWFKNWSFGRVFAKLNPRCHINNPNLKCQSFNIKT